MEKHLHIVSFDVPYPPDYGGVIPIFALLRKLKEEGILIHLHCFEYGRGEQSELNKYCTEVRYYRRNIGLKGFSPLLPYIVSSRISEELKQSLLADDYPVLFEGIHCSYLVTDASLSGRSLTVRLHNVEYLYYYQLYKISSNPFRKLYYRYESNLLRRFEAQIAKQAKIVTLSIEDCIIYKRQFAARNIIHIPMVLPYDEIRTKKGKGTYCLYHGNLSITENEKAATWLADKVFKSLNIPLIIAGKNPGKKLIEKLQRYPHIKIVSNPTEPELDQLISDAQINVLPSFNSTGIKLKFMNALYNGRHCIVNAAVACATQVVALCHVADDEAEFKSLIQKLFTEAMDEKEIKKRKDVLLKIFDNTTNTQSLFQWIC